MRCPTGIFPLTGHQTNKKIYNYPLSRVQRNTHTPIHIPDRRLISLIGHFKETAVIIWVNVLTLLVITISKGSDN